MVPVEGVKSSVYNNQINVKLVSNNYIATRWWVYSTKVVSYYTISNIPASERGEGPGLSALSSDNRGYSDLT